MRLDPTQTFRSFIVGPSNETAVAVVRRVVTRPWPTPVLLFGETGVGKSHLLNAAAAEARRAIPALAIRAFRTEEFMNEYVAAIRAGTMHQFRRHVRSGEMLIIDELEFLGDRESTIAELSAVVRAYIETRRPVLIAMEPTPHPLLEWFVDLVPSGKVAALRAPSVDQRVRAMRRAIGRKLSMRAMTALARGAATIPLARAAALNAVFRSCV